MQGALLIGQIVEKKLSPFSAQINGMYNVRLCRLSKLNFLRLVEQDPTKKQE